MSIDIESYIEWYKVDIPNKDEVSIKFSSEISEDQAIAYLTPIVVNHIELDNKVTLLSYERISKEISYELITTSNGNKVYRYFKVITYYTYYVVE